MKIYLFKRIQKDFCPIVSLSASRLLRDEYLMDINPILCCLDPLESDVFYVLAQCNKNKIYYSPILPVLPFFDHKPVGPLSFHPSLPFIQILHRFKHFRIHIWFVISGRIQSLNIISKAELLQLKLTPIICLMNFIDKNVGSLKQFLLEMFFL